MPAPIPEPYRCHADGFDVAPFHRLIVQLRHPELGCPWDRSRSLPDMAETLTGEAEEAAEALASQDHAHQCEELGDVLMNVMLATVIAEEQGLFTWRDVVEGVTAKLIGRHPHVFGDDAGAAVTPEEALRLYREAKAREKENG